MRSSGLLLHITSLPGPYGIGDLGPEARAFAADLADAGCTFWQVLPLGPTGYGDSPYQTFSAFAGNPYLVSPDDLVAEGLLQPAEMVEVPAFPRGRVDYAALIPWKRALLRRAFERFREGRFPQLEADLAAFRARHATWLDDFALFMALKEAHGGAPWTQWPSPLRSREPTALAQARQTLADAVERVVFEQFLFFRQWQALRKAAAARGVRFIGDAPIFVAHDSADVWAHPELFCLDETGQPTVVAGVPPDYFSPTGQRWGNPLYCWETHRGQGYAWWLARLRTLLDLVDVVRLDHFRGFVAYWEIPAEAPTAEAGRWVKGPGAAFFAAVRDALGNPSLIAEDLGVITPEVEALRDRFGFPGMKVLLFAFGSGPQNPFLPHNYAHSNFVVYTGTHDNDTAWGWWGERASEAERDFARRYLAVDGSDIAWDLIRAAWRSVAKWAIAPVQDVLGLGNEARMNYPGRMSGNWAWRMVGRLPRETLARLAEFNALYGRTTS